MPTKLYSVLPAGQGVPPVVIELQETFGTSPFNRMRLSGFMLVKSPPSLIVNHPPLQLS